MSDEDIEEMFAYADKDADGRITWTEFQVMINPPKPPEPVKPTLEDLAEKIKSEKRDKTFRESLSVKEVFSLSGNL